MKSGIYLGFSPTDESAVGLGELEIVINDGHLCWRHATGLEIDEATISLSDSQEMTREEIAAMYKEGTSSADKVAAGYIVGGLKFLFFDTDLLEKVDFDLIVILPDISAIFGPTVLYGPEKVADGEFDEAVKMIEAEAGVGVIPRLRNNGRAEK